MTTAKSGSEKSKKKSGIKAMAGIALMAAVCCVLCPLSIPVGPVPVSLGVFAMLLCAYLLGAKNGTIACGIYILLGLAGLPVFSGFTGGASKIAGPTGGYIIGYIFLVIISGLFIEHYEVNAAKNLRLKGNAKNIVMQIAGMILGIGVCYLFGTFWFMLTNGGTFLYVLSICVFPFIGFDVIKLIAALFVGNILRSRLRQAGLIGVFYDK